METLRAAVTGLGVVSPVGVGYGEFADSIRHGVTGLGTCRGGGPLAAEVAGFSVAEHLVAEKTYLDRCSEFALAATKLCLDDAGLERGELPADPLRTGLVLGTQFGCLGTLATYTGRVRQRGTRFATPLLFSHAFANTPASLISIDFRLKGCHATVTSGPASGSLALHAALVALAAGHADAVIAGGAEALAPDLVAGWSSVPEELDDPDAYDPFAGEGRPLGEGAALLLLERPEHAQARGARVRAWLEAGGDAGGAVRLAAHAPAAGADSGLAGLWGDALGAAGALAAAAGVAALELGVVPAVQAGDGPLDERREPVERPVAAVAVDDGPGGAALVLRR